MLLFTAKRFRDIIPARARRALVSLTISLAIWGLRHIVYPAFTLLLCCKSLFGITRSHQTRKIAESSGLHSKSLKSIINATMVRISHPSLSTFIFHPSATKFDDSHLLFCATRSNRRVNYPSAATGKILGTGSYLSQIVVFKIKTIDLISKKSPVIAGPVAEIPHSSSTDKQEYSEPRIFRTSNGAHISVTCNSASGFRDGSSAKVSIFNLDANLADRNNCQLLEYDDSNLIEKNWMPVSDCTQTSLKFIYRIHPTITLTYEPSSAQFSSSPGISRQESPRQLANYRGGSPLQKVPDSDFFICTAHFTHLSPARHYVHRFVIFRDSPDGMRVVGFSPTFHFRKPFDIEFSTGLTIAGNVAFVSFGFRDRESWVCSFDIATLLSKAINWC